MAYLGTPIDTRNQFQSLVGKRFDGDGSTTDFTLDVAPGSTLDIEVFVGNVRQDPNSAYTLSGTTLSFTGAPPSGTNNIYVVHQAKSVGTIDVPALGVSTASIQADAITEAKIADDAVESEHLNNNIISGQTELAATPADTDELIISDAGTLKRIDYSYIKAGDNDPMFSAKFTGSQSISSSSQVKITSFTSELYDYDSTYDGNRFTVPSGITDQPFFISGIVVCNGIDDGKRLELSVRVNGSEVQNNRTYSSAGNKATGTSVNYSQQLSTGDYVELYTYHDSSGSQDLAGGYFHIHKLIKG